MIGRLLLFIAIVLVAFILVQQLRKTPKDQLKNVYWKFILGAVAIALMLLAITGRIHWIGALFAALIPFVRQMIPLMIRFFPMIQHYRRTQTQPPPSSGNTSEVNTSILRMTLNHDNKHLSGEVISGPFQGQQLDAMELSQLQILLDHCHQQDQDSVKLLVNYLTHRFGNNWQNQQAPNHQQPDENAAYAILGLKPGASKTEVIKAHRQMMQKVHPDRGGSDYLAAQINEAKDLLMKQFS